MTRTSKTSSNRHAFSGTPDLRILHLEDSARDAEIIKARLENEGVICEIIRVQTKEEFLEALERERIHLIISDYTLPTMNGSEALALALEHHPDIPFLFLTGTMGEDAAVQSLIDGATDYVLKHSLRRLAPAVRRALEEARQRKERRETENALRLSEERLRLALDAAHMGTWDWDIEKGTVSWTDNVEHIFGLQKGSFLGTYDEYLKLVHSADREMVQRLNNQILAGPRDDYTVEHRILLSSGEIRWIEGRGRVYRDSGGKPSRMAGTIADVTRRKEVENELAQWQNRYELVVASSGLIVYDQDLRTGTIAWSGSVTRALGFELHEMNGGIDQWLSRVHASDRTATVAHLEEAKLKLKSFEVEYRFLAKSGDYHWMLDRGFFVVDDQGRPAHMLGILQEISERKRNEEDLRNSREQLRALAAHLQSIREEERTMIAREIHDELGQSLTGMKMDAAWLMKHLSAEQQMERQKAVGMISLIDSTIQTVRRIASELRPGVLDNLGLIAAIEWQAQEFQARTGIRCDVASNIESLPLEKLYSTALFRIFQETLTNIVRHANATLVRVRINAEKDMITLIVEDNGRGIEPDEISNSRSLGLLGIRERALLLGGTMHISGITGVGTTVMIWIPLSEAVTRKEETDIASDVKKSDIQMRKKDKGRSGRMSPT